VVFLLLLALGVLCVAGFFLVRVLLPDSPPAVLPSFITWTPSPSATGSGPQPTALPTITPAPGGAQIGINPEQGYINTLLTVTGRGWWPGEPVFIFLRSEEEGDARGFAYAAAVADDEGSFQTAVTFPNEMRWIGEDWADVIARGTRSGLEAGARFALVAPTPTNTLPPPTPRPTLLPTDTPWPTDTPSPTSTPTPDIVITDWRGEYFANQSPFGDPVLVRNDMDIDFDWDVGSPDPAIPVDGFSARWTRMLYFAEGPYRFYITVDDGVRFWIDGKLWVDEWHDSVPVTYSFDLYVEEGEHALHLEYYENLGGAMVQLSEERIRPETPTPTPTPTSTPTPIPTWTPIPTSTPQPTDTPQPIDTPTPELPDAWRGEYYANPVLNGPPVLTRLDPTLAFDWGTGSPGQGVPSDNFSARWAREIWVSAGSYKLYLQVDDGARVWVDGLLVIDAWSADPSRTYVSELGLGEGIHILKVEYFEKSGEARIHFWIE